MSPQNEEVGYEQNGEEAPVINQMCDCQHQNGDATKSEFKNKFKSLNTFFIDYKEPSRHLLFALMLGMIMSRILGRLSNGNKVCHKVHYSS